MVSTSGATIRLLLVDDHEVVRVGLRTLFSAAGHFEIVGEAGTIAAAINESRTHIPDVILMDLRLPDGSGADCCRVIRSELPSIRVVMLTSFAEQDAVLASVLAGASGYLLKQTPPARLIEAVEVVARGGSLLDPSITALVLDWVQKQAETGAADPLSRAGITRQERHVLPLLAEGRTNREIAEELALSERTVKTYVSNILQKLRLSRRSQAAAFMAQHTTTRQ